MPSLADIQRAMRRNLLGDDAAIAAFIVDDGIAAADRLGIYRNTFERVATRALRLNHPAIAKLVGDDFFEAAARTYLARRPPASAWLDRYGTGFAGFLARWEPVAGLAYLPDVARLEWSVSRALHAPDASALGAGALAALAALAPDLQSAVRFTRHPSLRLLRTRTPADAIWRATLSDDDDALAAIDLQAGPRWLLVARSISGVEVVALPEQAWRFARDLASGRTLHEALERAEPFDVAALLGSELAAGRFTAYRVATDAPAPKPKETAR
jgi:hypothetical protein